MIFITLVQDSFTVRQFTKEKEKKHVTADRSYIATETGMRKSTDMSLKVWLSTINKKGVFAASNHWG